MQFSFDERHFIASSPHPPSPCHYKRVQQLFSITLLVIDLVAALAKSWGVSGVWKLAQTIHMYLNIHISSDVLDMGHISYFLWCYFFLYFEIKRCDDDLTQASWHEKVPPSRISDTLLRTSFNRSNEFSARLELAVTHGFVYIYRPISYNVRNSRAISRKVGPQRARERERYSVMNLTLQQVQ